MPRNNFLESPESSSPIVTRAVAAGLQNKGWNGYQISGLQRLALRLLGTFPQEYGRSLMIQFERMNGLSSEQLSGLNSERLALDRLSDYFNCPGPFPCITMGAALGGATAHLSLALGGPFLPQAFVVSLRGGAPDGNVHTYLSRSLELALGFAAQNKDLMTIQHFDPVHDEWMTRYANFLRFKLLSLPQAYKGYIKRHLASGGAICYINCGANWLRYRLGERSIFQVGGWGHITANEFLDGSDRLRNFCRSMGYTYCDWKLPEYPLETGPESEWGSESELAPDIERFCQEEGYRFVRISLPEPHDFSRLAYDAIETLLIKEHRQPSAVMIECFSQFDATAVTQSGILPVWLIYNTLDSLAFLRSIRPKFPKNTPVFFSPLATFSFTPDLTPWQEWVTTLQGLEWYNIGARSSHYPSDVAALANWNDKLHAWVQKHNNPLQQRLSAEELLSLAGNIPR